MIITDITRPITRLGVMPTNKITPTLSPVFHENSHIYPPLVEWESPHFKAWRVCMYVERVDMALEVLLCLLPAFRSDTTRMYENQHCLHHLVVATERFLLLNTPSESNEFFKAIRNHERHVGRSGQTHVSVLGNCFRYVIGALCDKTRIPVRSKHLLYRSIQRLLIDDQTWNSLNRIHPVLCENFYTSLQTHVQAREIRHVLERTEDAALRILKDIFPHPEYISSQLGSHGGISDLLELKSLLDACYTEVPDCTQCRGSGTLIEQFGSGVANVVCSMCQGLGYTNVTLTNHRLGIMADKLEDMNIQNRHILDHLRQPGVTHQLGCWAVRDLHWEVAVELARLTDKT